MVIVSEIQALNSYQFGNMQQESEVLSVFGNNSMHRQLWRNTVLLLISPWISLSYFLEAGTT